MKWLSYNMPDSLITVTLIIQIDFGGAMSPKGCLDEDFVPSLWNAPIKLWTVAFVNSHMDRISSSKSWLHFRFASGPLIGCCLGVPNSSCKSLEIINIISKAFSEGKWVASPGEFKSVGLPESPSVLKCLHLPPMCQGFRVPVPTHVLFPVEAVQDRCSGGEWVPESFPSVTMGPTHRLSRGSGRACHLSDFVAFMPLVQTKPRWWI